MKYLLKQNKEDKGILCDKVTINGFDYYVSDMNSKRGWFYCYRTKSLFKDEEVDINCCNADVKVIATNNQNLDIPKVVDEVENLAWKHTKKVKSNVGFNDFITGYNKSQETHPFNEENMIEFLDFSKSTNQEKSFYEMECLLKGKSIDSKEIFQLWKEQQSKIVYYNE